MITYVDFSLFESPAQVLVNTVNTVGVMGKGIAKEFKNIYPEMFAEYQQLCEKGQLDIGQLWLYKTPHKWILNFPTKKHWRYPSKSEYIEAGLQKFIQIYVDARITSISFPMLGCGNGELDWEAQVRPLMEWYLKELPIQIFIHVKMSHSSFVPEHRDPAEIRAKPMPRTNAPNDTQKPLPLKPSR
jgi:O-acetyl-ADP-ribose deacetylase (regulator of RNase III)